MELHSSRSSSGSTKKPKLHGISEDNEEAPNSVTSQEDTQSPEATPKPSVEIETAAYSPVKPTSEIPDEPVPRPHLDTAALIERSRKLAAALENPEYIASELKIPETKETRTEIIRETPKEEDTELREDPSQLNPYLFDDDDDSSDGMYEFDNRRMSSQTARPTTSDYSGYSSMFRPKVMLGPRPSVDKRPPTSKTDSRPVASLPAGMRAQRPGASSARPKSRDSGQVSTRQQPPPPLPTESLQIPLIAPRPGSSRASVKSLPATLPKSPGLTPEKARLMKFRDMYRQREARTKKRMSTMEDAPPMPSMPKEFADEQKVALPEAPKVDVVQEEEEKDSTTANDHVKSDSGIGMSEAEIQEKLGGAPESEPSAETSVPLGPVVEPAALPVLEEKTESTEERQIPSAVEPTLLAQESLAPQLPQESLQGSPQEMPAQEPSLTGLRTEKETPSLAAEPLSDETSEIHPMRELQEKPTLAPMTFLGIDEAKPVNEVGDKHESEEVPEASTAEKHAVAMPVQESIVNRPLEPEAVKAISEPTLLQDVAVLHESFAAEPELQQFLEQPTVAKDIQPIEVTKSMDEGPKPTETFDVKPAEGTPVDGVDEELPSTATFLPEPKSNWRSSELTIKGAQHAGAEDAQEDGPQPTPLSESVITAPSPVSIPDSAAHLSSTATSVSDDNMEEKSGAGTAELVHESEVDAPSAIHDNELAQSPASQDTERASAPVDVLPTPEIKTEAAELPSPMLRDPMDEPPATHIVHAAVSHSRHGSVNSAKTKRRGLPATEPGLVDISASTSEADYDEDLMDELDQAQVHQATPISVSKSPVNSFFPSRPSTGTSMTSKLPTPSNAPPMPLTTHLDRKASGSLLSGLPPSEESLTTPKMKIEGGIAAKIADLQRSFNRAASPTSQTPSARLKTPESRKPSLIYQRANVLRSTPPSSSPASTPGYVRPSSKASYSSTDAESPERERPQVNSTLGSRINLFNQSKQKPIKPETVPVTARMIRANGSQRTLTPATTNGDKGSKSDTPSEKQPGLQDSPAFEARDRAMPISGHRRTQSSTSHYKGKNAKSVTSDAVKSSSTVSLTQTSTPSDGRENLGHGFTRISIDNPLARPGRGSRSGESKAPMSSAASTTSLLSGNEPARAPESPVKEEKKKGSRASRLMKRMSASVSRLPLGPLSPQGSKPNDGHNTMFSHPPISPVIEAPPRPQATDIGDLNVQFPDTLLWKRRWVEIDGHGFMIIKPYGASERGSAANGIVKKFHLNEFEMPFAPDLERQEMPNSIMLDFKDGRTLQLSCASSSGQKGVLRCEYSLLRWES